MEAVEQMVQETEAQEVLQQPLDLLRQMAVAAEAVVIQALDFLEALEEERLEDFQEVLDQEIHLLELHLKEILVETVLEMLITHKVAVVVELDQQVKIHNQVHL